MPADPSLTFEELAKRAQRFLADRPVVILGTGATIPYGLPSMSTLADKLLTTVSDRPPGWETFATHLEETKDLEQALQEVALPQETAEVLVRATWEIVSEKDVAFYEQLLNGTPSFPLAELFRYLLRTADAHLQVVTTNYDRVAEYAANRVQAYVSTGITAGWLQRFVPTAVSAERRPAQGFQGMVTLLKVHGSLDWFRDPTQAVVGIPLSRSIPVDMQPLVVTPGVLKYREVHKDPFRTVMSAADEVLRGAACYVCVGYGFNDEHVQPVLVHRVMREDKPLLLITRTLTRQTRAAFLDKPPKRFLFLEEAPGGTKVYTPDHPSGTVVSDISIWKLHDFMQAVTANGGS